MAVLACHGAAAQDSGRERRVIDRLVAVVDTMIVTNSDVDAALAVSRLRGDQAGSREEALNKLIEQRLIRREIRGFPGVEPSPAEVAEQLRLLEEKHQADGGLKGMAPRWGLSLEEIESEVRWQLRMKKFTEVRFLSFISIGEDEISRYYNETLPRVFRQAGQSELPPLDTVRQQIRDNLTERRLGDELERWIRELVNRADIQRFPEGYRLAAGRQEAPK